MTTERVQIFLTDRQIKWFEEQKQLTGIKRTELVRRILDEHIDANQAKGKEAACH